jgi:hypothetical protein
MSAINWGGNPLQHHEGGRCRGSENHAIQLVDADKELTYTAAKLKAAYGIAYADYFAAALSAKLDAPLIPGDPDFKQLAHEIGVEWIT